MNADNQDACLSKTSKTLGQCILDCNDDNSCETACVSAFKDEHSECPCQVRGTQKIIFRTISQENCPLGCPCDNYDCDLPDKKAILTLNTFNENSPVLIQPNGQYSFVKHFINLFKVV